jgi:methionine aminopeptidase
MIYLKSENEIDKMRISAQLVSQTLAEVARYIEPGVTTGKLDQVAEEFIKKIMLVLLSKGTGLQIIRFRQRCVFPSMKRWYTVYLENVN